jgi:hypothetical protein
VARTWILTGSPENHAATSAQAFGVIGLKERNRNRALEIEPDDRIVLYATRVKAFAGSIVVIGELFEERSKIWPGKPGKADIYPWRFPTRLGSGRGADRRARARPEMAAGALDARVPGADPAGVRARCGGAARADAGGREGRGRHVSDAPGAANALARWLGALARWAAALIGRLARAWRVLPPERRLAAIAAVGLFVALFLPWYQETVLARGNKNLQTASASLTGWAAFSFVEAAVLLVAVGVLVLLIQRAEGHAFHVPGGDGFVVTAAGVWTCGLIVWRIFDKQGTNSHGAFATTSGIEWGIFAALAVAALLAYSGQRIRVAHQPEPPLPGEGPVGPSAAGPPGGAPPHDSEPPTAVMGAPGSGGAVGAPTTPAAQRPARRPVAPDEQLTMPLDGDERRG